MDTVMPFDFIIYEDRECDCEKCVEYRKWFDSNEGGDPPETCGGNIIAAGCYSDDGDARIHFNQDGAFTIDDVG